MLKHEHYQEICAAASAGQASGSELAELRQHLESCDECRRTYSQFVEILGNHHAVNGSEHELSEAEALECIDSSLLRARFFKRAESQGIVFSALETTAAGNASRTHFPRGQSWTARAMWSAAMLVIAGVGLAGYYAGTREHSFPAATRFTQRADDISDARVNALRNTVEDLKAGNRKLAAELSAVESTLARTSLSLNRQQNAAAINEKERSTLAAALMERDGSIAGLQKQLADSQIAAAAARSELGKAQAGAAEHQAVWAESQVRVRELSEQLAETSAALDRQKELFSAGRDIRELMAARNLHIVDVADTDPRGKLRSAFGRIFFTEGKSLIFYAYDLNDAKVLNAGYHYRVWGKREGASERPRNLGMFYSDNKAQKRWVFQYDDPKVLDEIDSVFVTLEPPNGKDGQPAGDKLMYAYLRGQANHP